MFISKSQPSTHLPAIAETLGASGDRIGSLPFFGSPRVNDCDSHDDLRKSGPQVVSSCQEGDFTDDDAALLRPVAGRTGSS